MIEINNILSDIKRKFSNKLYTISAINLALIIFQLAYIQLRYTYLNSTIPFWFSKAWGSANLAERHFIYLIPLAGLVIFLGGLLMLVLARKIYFRHAIEIISLITIFSNSFLTYSLIKIIFSASIPFPPLLNPFILNLALIFIFGFLVVYFLLPHFIDLMFDHDIVTNPNLHRAPSMLLKEPSARGGGVFFGLIFIILGVVTVGFTKTLLPLYLGVFFLSILSLLDDFQNTHLSSKLRFLENPLIRFLFLVLITSIVGLGSARINFITVPFDGGTLEFNSGVISYVFTIIWIVWVMNVLSWSNGIDGQFAGVVGFASLTTLLLALRVSKMEEVHLQTALLSALSAGIAFGFTQKTWHPSKIMWGFGAICTGFTLSYLSILINAKIITSILVILIPFIDGGVSFVRRVIKKQNPMKGDRMHFHHLLLNRGWSIQRIAIFYWLSTAVIGFLAYLTADKFTWQVGLILVGIAGFIISIMNIRSQKNSIQPQ